MANSTLVRCLRIGTTFATVALASCNGDAPILTCHNPCSKPDEYRDLFCECQIKSKAPTGLGGDTTVDKPAFDWQWEETDSCFLNRHYWLLNPTKYTLAITVSRRLLHSTDRAYDEYVLRSHTLNRADGIDLGFEEIGPGKDCFDQDFMLGGWRQPAYASTKESLLAELGTLSDVQLSRKRALAALIERPMTASTDPTVGIPQNGPTVTVDKSTTVTQKIEEVLPIDCVAACDSGDSSCGIRGFPPDQDKLKHVHDDLRAAPTKTGYSAANIYSIFGLDKSSCTRGDVRAVGNKLFNEGQYCAFPMFLRETDKKPSISIHFPTAVKGERVGSGVNSGGISFNAGANQPVLLFANRDWNDDFGGVLLDAVASERGIYYQTTGGCIFVGAK